MSEWPAGGLVDHEELANRLSVLVPSRMAASFAIDHLTTQMIYLDVAIQDYEAASSEFREAMRRHAQSMLEGYGDEAEARAAEFVHFRSLRETGMRFHYRLDCAYGAARRVLDRVVVVVHELLPRTSTDVGRSHHGFGPRLLNRCKELELDVPEALVAQIQELDDRVRLIRDHIEHVQMPVAMRFTRPVGDDFAVELKEVVRAGEHAEGTSYESPVALRQAIHAYVGAMLELLESARKN